MTGVKVWDRVRVIREHGRDGRGGTQHLVYAVEGDLALLETDIIGRSLGYLVFDLERGLVSAPQVIGRVGGPRSKIAAMQEVAEYGWWKQVETVHPAVIEVMGSRGEVPIEAALSEEEAWERSVRGARSQRKRLKEERPIEEYRREQRFRSALRGEL